MYITIRFNWNLEAALLFDFYYTFHSSIEQYIKQKDMQVLLGFDYTFCIYRYCISWIFGYITIV